MDIIRIMKINAWLMGAYAMVRAAAIVKNLSGAGPAAVIAVSLAALALVRFLTGNMWKLKGMLSLTFMFSLIVSDIAVVTVSLVSRSISGNGLFLSGSLYTVWICCGIGLAAWGLLMLYGYINEKHVKATEYTFCSEKIKEDLRICVMSDIHFGTIQKKDTLAKHIEIINSYKPDIILLAGDVTEERTSGEDMSELFRHLSKLSSRYGTYFVHGNHDKQQKLTAKERTYTDEEFDRAMKEAGIHCLDDDCVKLRENVTVIGRNDYTEKKRAGLETLLKETDPSSYRILFEHQPEEYKDCAAAGIEMHITGHYHGAQNWPNNILYKLADIKYLGIYRIGEMKLLVNAGFTGSAYPIRSHSKCEYLIINLKKS